MGIGAGVIIAGDCVYGMQCLCTVGCGAAASLIHVQRMHGGVSASVSFKQPRDTLFCSRVVRGQERINPLVNRTLRSDQGTLSQPEVLFVECLSRSRRRTYFPRRV